MRHFFNACNLQRKKWYRELADDDTLAYAYFVIRRRMLQPAHFVLTESEEQKRSLLKPEVKIAYERLKAVLQNGGDLKPYHTQNSRILYPCDGLLEMHGINHLHLLRGKYQVYFFSEGTSVFIIKVVTHFARHHTDFSKIPLLNILEKSIPDYYSRMPWLQSHSADVRLTERFASPYGWFMVDEWKNRTSQAE